MTTYYFVTFWDKNGGGLHHFGHLGSGNILWYDSPTLFRTYDKARGAIKRTQTYAKKNKMPWFDNWHTGIERAVLPK